MPPGDPNPPHRPPAPSVGDAPTVTGTPTPASVGDAPTVTASPHAAFPDSHAPTVMAPITAPPGFTIERELGRGGMGVVYLAHQTGLNRRVALKMILGDARVDQKAIIRFLAEAEAVASVRHPSVVEVYQFGEHAGRPFMALEFCPGGSLADGLGDGAMEPELAAETLAAVAEGVAAAHAQGIVHRDLKPHNVLVAGDGTPKVTDFGLAKKVAGDSELTKTNAVMGTPAYMAPEQAGGGTKFVGPPADVWALGVMLYEALCGQRPFKGDDTWKLLAAVINADVMPLRKKVAGVPRDLELICLKCLSKDARDRYPDAGDLAKDLRRFLAGEAVSVRPAGPVERAVKWGRRNKAMASLGAVVLLTLTAGVAVSSWFAWQAGEEARAARKAEETAADEAKAARKAEAEAKAREKAEAAAKALAQVETNRANDNLRRAQWAVYSGKRLLAQAAYNENKMPDAFRHLEECQWDLRGWEHAHLRWRFDSRRQTFRGHTGSVGSVTFSPDGKRILTSSQDQTAKVWNAETGIELLALQGHTNYVTSAAFSPDGKRILTGSFDNTAKVWDAETGTELVTLEGHPMLVTSVAFSPDGKRILTGGGYCTAKVWDAETGMEALALNGHSGEITSVAFSPDGKRILTGSFDRTAKMWDAEKGNEALTIKGHRNSVTSVAFSPDGKRILTGSADNTAKVWDAQKGTEVLELQGHTGPVNSVVFSPDGKRILTGSGDRVARVWDAERGTELLALKGHTGYVASVVFSPDGKRILTGGQDRMAKVWDVQKGTEVLCLNGHTSTVSSVAFSPDGKKAFAWDAAGKVLAWDTTTGQPVAADQPPPRITDGRSVTSPDGRLSARAYGNQVRFVDLRQPAPQGSPWPFPDAAERRRYHTERATLAEKEGQRFAAAFHLGRLLLDDPGNADLTRRRAEALKHLEPGELAPPPRPVTPK